MSKTKNSKRRSAARRSMKKRNHKFKQKRIKNNILPPTFYNLKRTIVNDIKSQVNGFQVVTSPNINCTSTAGTTTLHSWDTMNRNVSRTVQGNRIRNHKTVQNDIAYIPNIAVTVDRTLELRKKRFSEKCEQTNAVSAWNKTARKRNASEECKIKETNVSTSSVNCVTPNVVEVGNTSQKNLAGTDDNAISETTENASDLVIVIDDSLNETCPVAASSSQDQSIIELSDGGEIILCESDNEETKIDDVISLTDSGLDETEHENVKFNSCFEKQQADTSVIVIEDDQQVVRRKRWRRSRIKCPFKRQENHINTQDERNCVNPSNCSNTCASNGDTLSVVKSSGRSEPVNVTWGAIANAQKMLQQMYSVTNTLVQQQSVIASRLDNLENQTTNATVTQGTVSMTNQVNTDLFDIPLYTEANMDLLFGSNYYNAGRIRKEGLRVIIIDGSNVAMGHSNGRYFSVEGLKICIDYFVNRGHRVKAFIPHFRLKHGGSSNPQLLRELCHQNYVICTPSREVNGRRICSYDDRFIVQCAAVYDGIIVSCDKFRDLIQENPHLKPTIETKLLMPTWVDNMIIFPSDPLGRNGPTLERFLRFP